MSRDGEGNVGQDGPQPSGEVGAGWPNLVEDLPAAVWLTGERGEALYLNARWTDLTGLSRAASLGFGWAQAVHPDDRAGVLERWRQTWQEGAPYENVTFRLRRRGGEYRFYAACAERVETPGGVRFIGICLDAHEQTLAGERAGRLLRVTARLSQAPTVEAVTAALLDEGMHALGAAQATAHLRTPSGGLTVLGAVGYPDEVLERYREIPPGSALPVMRAAQEGRAQWIEDAPRSAAANPELARWTGQVQNGAGAALPLGEGGRLGAMSVTFAEPRTFDPGERTFAETLAGLFGQALERAQLLEEAREALRGAGRLAGELRRSERRFRTFFDISPVGASISRLRDGLMVDVNPAFERLVGLSREEMLGRTSIDLGLWENRAEREARIGAVMARDVTRSWDTTQRQPDGELRHVLASLAQFDFDHEPHLLVMVQDITARKRAEEERQRFTDELQHLAHHDVLTGLPNRRALEARLGEWQADPGRTFALAYLDVPRFRHVNDTLGRAAGDALLVQLARRLEQACAEQGGQREAGAAWVTRLDGGLFTVVSPGGAAGGAGERLGPLLAALGEPYEVQGHELHLQARVGWASYPEDAPDVAGLHRAASIALNKAETGGREVERYVEGGPDEARDRLWLEADLRRALRREGELRVHYQPIVNVDRGQVVGWEALVRWQHPTLGLLGPGRFLDLAEDTGLISGLSSFVLRRAAADAARWQSWAPGQRVNVNLAAAQFGREDLAASVGEALSGAGLPPGLLELEVPETLVMRDVPRAVAQLQALQSLGVTTALDDFGTGYSNLAQLRHLPLSTLKVDKAFVRGLGEDEAAADVLESVVKLARRLGLHVVVEGVETRDQLDALRPRDACTVQGFYYARPMPGEAMQDFLRRHALRPKG